MLLDKLTTDPANHKVFFDNFFTSYDLLCDLRRLGYRATGTISENRTKKCPLTNAKDMKKKARGEFDDKKKALKEVTNTYLRENTPDSDQISPDSPIIERPRSAGSKRVVARKRLAKNRRDRIMRQKNKQVDYYKKKMEKYKKKFQRLTKRN